MKDAGTLDLARAAIAKRRAPGQIAPSKYLPDVPRQVHAAGGKVDDARADFLAGNHPEVPPVVYHSTKGDFHAFRPMSHFGTEKAAHDRYHDQSWHPAHLETSRKFADLNIIPAHISLKNPIDVGTEREWQSNRDTLRQVADWMGGKLDKKYAYARQKLKDLVGDPRWGDYPHAMEQRGADIIRDTGHDGIIYTNTIEDPGSRSFITLGPEQVKSTISAREFDPTNPDMTKAEGGAITKADGGTVEGAETVARMLREGRASEITNEHLDAADPQHLWKLYETGQTGMDMPMDHDSRMARANKMGMNYEGYHSSLEDLKKFNKTGKFYGHKGTSGISMTDVPDVANRYLDRYGEFNYKGDPFEKNVIKVKANLGKVDLRENPYTQSGDNMGAPLPYGYIPFHKRLGFDTAQFPDEISKTGGVKHKGDIKSTETVMSDPTNIRSIFARFDPRLAHLSHLNASTGGKMENPVDLNVERARKNVASGDLPQHVQNTFDSMAERNRAQLAAHQEAMQAGAFDDTRIGDEYRAPDGSTFKITNHFMMPANRWGGREPPSMVYQGHVPMVSTVYTDPKMKGFDMNRAVEHVRQMERIGGPLRVAKAGGGGMGDGYVPQRTVKAYKLFRTKGDGKLYPLFVHADNPVETGKWLEAEEGPQGKTQGRVKSKIGDLAYRPGWHAGDLPIATHIGGKSDPSLNKPDYRPDNHVWAEVEIAADHDWQSEADSRGKGVKAHITDQVPLRGFYRYKTNPNMTGNWLIGGHMKVNRVLSDDEVKAINDAAGVADLPRLSRVAKAGGGGMGDEGFDFKPIPEQSITLSDGSVHYYTPLDVAATEKKSISAPTEKNAAYVVGKDDAARNFREWFGNSVTHTDGKPHVFYHGTSKDKDFTSFNVGRHGAWFTRKPEEASQYAEQNDSMGYKRDGWKVVETNTQSRVIPAYLKAENPYTGEYSGAVTGNYKKDQSDWFDTLRAKGHDAWMPSSSGGNLVVVLKEPQQIKSLYNNGNFDPKQKHIAKAGGGDVEDLGVHRFHRQLNSDVQSTMNDMVDAHRKALDAGVFDGYEVGDRLQGQVGPLTVKARYMAKWRPGGASDKTIQRMGQIPTLMDHNGVTYHPMLRLTGADGSEGDYPLDAVRGYPKFTGLRVAKKNGGGVKLYSKAAQIIRGLPQAKGKAEDMVKAALGKGAKRAELEHADVAPGMASRDQVADYLEAVQPRIGVKKRGEGIGLTAQERDELGYLRSMMPHQRTPENDQRIAELKEKQFSSPQYEQYQLPGGTNYREHILTLPDQADEYFANSHWGNISNPIAHVRMSDRAAPSGMSPWDWMDAHDRMMKAVGVTDPGSLAAGAPDAAVAKGAITPEEARAIAVEYGWTGSKYYKPKKILHVEEMQSDWNSDARRRGFRTGTEQQDYDNFVKDMRQKVKYMIDKNSKDREFFEKRYNEMDPHSLARKIGQAEEHDRLYRLAKYPGPPKAPYVNPKSDDWAELAMKHVLHEAAQGGYDGITFTPDAEQSKRWGGTEFKGMYDKKFPSIAHRLVQQHDPSITPSTTPITPFLQGPMIPLTEQARRGILENGFSSFKKGGYVR